MFSKLKSGLAKSADRLSSGIGGIFTKSKLDQQSVARLEEVLIEADLGVKLSGELSEALSAARFDTDVSPQDVKQFLAARVAEALKSFAVPLVPDIAHKPSVIVLVGVNGNGKTTTAAKLAHRFKSQGLKVMMAAGDTFRAAATEQLQEWGKKIDVPVVTGAPHSDPASVAFTALERAKAECCDVLLVDTAGRLHNKTDLMDELKKIMRVLQKADVSAPHHVVQVLDATTGQNAIAQVEAFKDAAKVTGLIVTKLDGTAKGGVVVSLARAFSLPIHAVGTGEGMDDLDAFDADDFASNLMALRELH